MKLKTLLFLFLLTVSLTTYGQLSTGDIAFVGFNADGDSDISFVVFEEIPAGTTLYFCDSELASGAFGTDENDVIWTSDINTPLPAGSVVTINNLDDVITASTGTVTGGTGLSKNGDAIFAYIGTDIRQPTVFLAAISNLSTGFGDLTGSGLVIGTTAIVLTETADIAKYVGSKTGIDKNGYLVHLNDMANWEIQDTEEDDDHSDGIGPDLPFDNTSFTISSTDVTAPQVANVNVASQSTLEVSFTENVTEATATNISNYVFTPSSTISDITYNQATQTATVTHSGLTAGASTTISISNIADATGNTMASTYETDAFFFNATTPELIITEIMYNAPSDASDNLEFIEIYNAGDATVALGGISVKDEANFVFVFPEMDLTSEATVLLATDAAAAGTFYNQTFLSLVASTGNMLGNGGELLQIENTNGDLIFAVEYDDGSPWPTDPDGSGPSLELLALDKDVDEGTSWTASSTLVGQSEGADVFASPGSFTEVVNPLLGFEDEYVTISKDEGSITLSVELSDPSAEEITVEASLLSNFGTANITFETQTLTFPANSTASQSFEVTLSAQVENNTDEFFIIKLSNPSNAELGTITETVVYVLDEEKTAPVATNELEIEFATSYLVDSEGSAEIVAFDSTSNRLFVMNSIATKVEILDFSDPKNITPIKSIDMTSYGDGATSIAVKDGIIAATVVGVDFADGILILMNVEGEILSSVTVGNLPDMVTFTHDGQYVLIANEGQPNDDYSIDPEGSISMIDISNGAAEVTQSDVTTIDFHDFDSEIDALKADGVRIFGLNATVSKDMEPEYITVSADSKKAWVSLQENNALATIDLVTKTITEIIPLGVKDHSLAQNTLDASDKTDNVIMANWPIKGLYMPDAIASYSVGDVTYVVTANEGDQREYGDAIDEDVTISDGDYILDPTVFPQGDLMKKDFTLGRLAVSPYSGDIDNDGDFDEIHAFGARSFSIWNMSTGKMVYDSGSDFEMITALDPIYGSLFNVSNSNNNFKNRSDNKGPEPEGVTVAEINDQQYAFITLERTGGIMTYNITDPSAPVFVNYSNNRLLGDDEGGDLGPEGILYIDEVSSPSDTALVVVANEVSATVSVYYLKNVFKQEEIEEEEEEETPLSVDLLETSPFNVYPNPANGKTYFNKPTTYTLIDMGGNVLKTGKNAVSIDTSDLTSGIYILNNTQGKSTKMIITH